MSAVEHKYTLQRVTVLMIGLKKKNIDNCEDEKNIWEEDGEILLFDFLINLSETR